MHSNDIHKYNIQIRLFVFNILCNDHTWLNINMYSKNISLGDIVNLAVHHIYV